MRVGLDIGGTKTAGVIVGDDGTVLRSYSAPTGYGPDAVVGAASDAVHGLLRSAGRAAADLDSVGVGIPGVVDHVSGTVSHAVNLGLRALPLGTRLQDLLGAPVHVENDVNVGALGAFRLLGLDAASSMAYLNLGTGLAAGLVLRGELWRGSRGVAGEIGHLPIRADGPLCACGQRGCLELMASGSAIERAWPVTHPRPVVALHAAASAGDPRASEVWATLVENIAAAVRVMVLVVDVDVVVLGGGVTTVGEPLVGAVRQVLRGWAASSQFLGSLDLADRVRLLPIGSDVAPLGAAQLGVPVQRR
ncbi:ROK family protein [Georgenia sp. M64]|uniref:ROK family protein n=1 Tax=Georgenia sp. M64 TaxID=3120520 RepID=UPI0030E3B168